MTINLGLTRRWAGRPGAVERAEKALRRRQPFEERCGYVARDSWAGRTTTHVRVIGETSKRYRARFPDGAVRLVPKDAVRLLLPGECIQHDTASPIRSTAKEGT